MLGLACLNKLLVPISDQQLHCGAPAALRKGQMVIVGHLYDMLHLHKQPMQV